jgi:hypothetical protein
MRALILCLAVVTASAAWAQTETPSRDILALAERAARAADTRLEQGLQQLVDGFASGYRDGAARTGQTVDEKALADVSKSEFAASRPMLWSGLAKVYAATYSKDELNAIIAYYRDHPGDRQNLPAALAAKNDELARRQRELVGQIGPRIMQDFFGDYCSRAPCTDYTRRTAGLPVKSAN